MGIEQDLLKPKERLKLYGQGMAVDRIPCTMSISETAPLAYGISIRDYYFSPKQMVEVETGLARDFGLDNMGVGIGLRGIAEALGAKLQYSDNQLSYIATPMLTTYEDLDRMQVVDPYKDGRLPLILEADKILADAFEDEYTLSVGISGPLSTVASLRGAENMARDTLRNAEDLHRVLKLSVDCILACAKVFHKETGALIALSDPIASSSMIGLAQYREFAKPYLASAVQGIAEITGAVPGVHVCGKTKDRWEDIAQTGISLFSVDDCENLGQVKSVLGDKVKIAGNVPPVAVLRNGTGPEISESVKQCILDGSDSPKGFILSPGCQVPIGTPKENIHAFMQAARTYGRGAKLGSLCKGVRC